MAWKRAKRDPAVERMTPLDAVTVTIERLDAVTVTIERLDAAHEIREFVIQNLGAK